MNATQDKRGERGFYIPVYSQLLRELDVTDALVYGYLDYRVQGNRERPVEMSMDELAEELGKSVSTVKRSTKKLRDRGYLTAKRRVAWQSTLVWSTSWPKGR